MEAIIDGSCQTVGPKPDEHRDPQASMLLGFRPVAAPVPSRYDFLSWLC